jgi:5-methylcytosine-specific restriction endonuclease McrA
MKAPTPEFQLAFLTKIQRLFAEGDFTATYKFALLVSIADYAVQYGEDNNEELKIPTRSIGAKFIELYWQQSAPYKDGVLVQNLGAQAAVVAKVAAFRNSGQSLTQALQSRQLVTAVTATVVTQPIKYMQNLGGSNDAFLYVKGEGFISLLPGVAYCLRRFQPLIQQLSRAHWIDHIKSNKQNQPWVKKDSDLESFLFKTSRPSLEIVQAGLRKISNRCFYCNGLVSNADVDHFIPRTLYPRDLAHNFVLTDPKCNRSKSDTLAAKQHLFKWLEFVHVNSDNLNQIGFEAGILADADSSNSVAKWGYNNANAGGAKAWIKSAQYEPVDDSYLLLWSYKNSTHL